MQIKISLKHYANRDNLKNDKFFLKDIRLTSGNIDLVAKMEEKEKIC